RLRRCTERRRCCVEAYLALAAALVTLRALPEFRSRLSAW
ncbi:MAG TPA: IS5/IS1182 family transposase, partial [Gaiellales bacterium]|nr:IS5/IS1182 family transposase [Gaiellales bacterium]